MNKSFSSSVGKHLRSNVIGYMALFVALSGSAYAAAKVNSTDIAANAVQAKHIRAGAITASEIKKNAIKSADVKDAGLLPKDVRGLEGKMRQVDDISRALGGAAGSFQNLVSRISALEAENNQLTGQIDSLLDTLGLADLSDLSTLDLRLDAVCEQLDGLTAATSSLRSALVGLPIIGAILDPLLGAITVPVFDETLCQG